MSSVSLVPSCSWQGGMAEYLTGNCTEPTPAGILTLHCPVPFCSLLPCALFSDCIFLICQSNVQAGGYVPGVYHACWTWKEFSIL